MNSFQIVKAKKLLGELLAEQPEHRLHADRALSLLNEAGFQVSPDVLRVLVLGSSTQNLAFNEDGTEIVAIWDTE